MTKSLSSILTSSTGAIDPSLDALFSSSVGPAKPAKASSKAKKQEAEPATESSEEEEESKSDEGEEDDADSDEASEESDEEVEDAPAPKKRAAQDAEQTEGANARTDRKRKRKDPTDDIEARHLQKLMEQDDEPSQKRKKGAETSEGKDGEPASEEASDDDDNDGEAKIVHESLADTKDVDADKADRTVFLANVSTEVISSKQAKKTLEKHLESILDKTATPPEKLESTRFRSLAFSSLSLPKRAAYITKSLMETTTRSCNAYAVYSTAAAARKAVSKLNATQVLDRHLRVDSVAHPSPTDHRRCVFVGNLGFVDDETVENTDAKGVTTTKKRYKVPSDIEEGLWRVFNEKAGKVESVRVIRDPKTRVGKGFAYVQFYDANHVEAALLLDKKKFTPMLPRPLRVTRAKNPRSTTQALQRRGIQPSTGPGATKGKGKPASNSKKPGASRRDMKLLGVSGAARQSRQKEEHAEKKVKTPERIIFEGKRAMAGDAGGLAKRHKAKKSVTGKRLKGKRADRAKNWKKGAVKTKE